MAEPAEPLPLAATDSPEPQPELLATPDVDSIPSPSTTTPDLFPKNPQLKFVRGVVGLSITFWTALIYTLFVQVPMTPLFRLAFRPHTFMDPRTSRPGELVQRHVVWWATVLLSAPLGVFCAVGIWATCRALWWRSRWRAKGVDIKGAVARPGTRLSLEAVTAALTVHTTVLLWLFYPDAKVAGYPLPNVIAVPAGVVMLVKAYARHRSPLLNPLKLSSMHPVAWDTFHGTALLIIALLHPTLCNPSPLLTAQLSDTDLRRTATAAEWLGVVVVFQFVTSLQADLRTVDWAVDKVREVVGREAEKLRKEREEEHERRRTKGKQRADDQDAATIGDADTSPTKESGSAKDTRDGGDLLEITLRTLSQSSPERVALVAEAAVGFITRGRLGPDDALNTPPAAPVLGQPTGIPVPEQCEEHPSADASDAAPGPVFGYSSTEPDHDTLGPATPAVEHAPSDIAYIALDPDIPIPLQDFDDETLSLRDVDVPLLAMDTAAPDEDYDS